MCRGWRLRNHNSKLRQQQSQSATTDFRTYCSSILNFDFSIRSSQHISIFSIIDEENTCVSITIDKILKTKQSDESLCVDSFTWYGWKCRGQEPFNVDITRSLPIAPACGIDTRHHLVWLGSLSSLPDQTPMGRGRGKRPTVRPRIVEPWELTPSVVKFRPIETVILSTSSPPVGRRLGTGRFVACPRWRYFEFVLNREEVGSVWFLPPSRVP